MKTVIEKDHGTTSPEQFDNLKIYAYWDSEDSDLRILRETDPQGKFAYFSTLNAYANKYEYGETAIEAIKKAIKNGHNVKGFNSTLEFIEWANGMMG